jgi:hypothetical protein
VRFRVCVRFPFCSSRGYSGSSHAPVLELLPYTTQLPYVVSNQVACSEKQVFLLNTASLRTQSNSFAIKSSRPGWLVMASVVLPLRRLRQKGFEFEANLGYKVV